MTEQWDFATRQIHAGETLDADHGARVPPIYQTAGYVFPGFDEAEARFAGASSGRAYSRTENPTNALAAARLADLEGAAGGVLVGSGQAAIACVLFALGSAGDRVLATDSLYGGTRQLFEGTMTRQGLTFDFLPESASDEEWAARITPRTKAIYTESLPNPLNDAVDLERLARIAHAAGVPLVVDNTVPTPYLCRPIEWGADVVIHSTSKWLSGHGAVIGGAILDAGRFDWAADPERFPQFQRSLIEGGRSFVERFGRATLLAYLKTVTVLDYGPSVPALSTFLLLHGLDTLSLRMERHVQNAQAVAEWLATRDDVTRVHYPGLPGDAFHDRAAKYLPAGAGSIVSFDIAGGRAAAARFLESLRLVSHMTHIGDVRTLAIHMGSTINGRTSEAERLAVGITPGFVRLSIGIEGAADIIADLEQALAAAAEA